MPLHDAAAGGYVDIVRMLLQAAAAAGSDMSAEVVSAADGDGEMPLHMVGPHGLCEKHVNQRLSSSEDPTHG
jgi:hypothetical protein